MPQELENQVLELRGQLGRAGEEAATHRAAVRAKDGEVAKMARALEAVESARDETARELAHAAGELKVLLRDGPTSAPPPHTELILRLTQAFPHAYTPKHKCMHTHAHVRTHMHTQTRSLVHAHLPSLDSLSTSSAEGGCHLVTAFQALPHTDVT